MRLARLTGTIPVPASCFKLPSGLIVRRGTQTKISAATTGSGGIMMSLQAEERPRFASVQFRGLVPARALEDNPSLDLLLAGCEIEGTMLGGNRLGLVLGLVPDGRLETELLLVRDGIVGLMFAGPRMEDLPN